MREHERHTHLRLVTIRSGHGRHTGAWSGGELTSRAARSGRRWARKPTHLRAPARGRRDILPARRPHSLLVYSVY